MADSPIYNERDNVVIESKFQSDLIKELKSKFEGCIILKNDPNYIQGISDLTIFYKNKLAILECKKNKNAKRRPNQEYYVSLMNNMSCSYVIFPENKNNIIDCLDKFFKGGSK